MSGFLKYFFVVGWLVLLLHVVTLNLLVGYLRRRQHGLWQSLGFPTNWATRTVVASRVVYHFARGRHRELRDPRLDRLANIMVTTFYVFVVVCLFWLILFIGWVATVFA